MKLSGTLKVDESSAKVLRDAFDREDMNITLWYRMKSIANTALSVDGVVRSRVRMTIEILKWSLDKSAAGPPAVPATQDEGAVSEQPLDLLLKYPDLGRVLFKAKNDEDYLRRLNKGGIHVRFFQDAPSSWESPGNSPGDARIILADYDSAAQKLDVTVQIDSKWTESVPPGTQIVFAVQTSPEEARRWKDLPDQGKYLDVVFKVVAFKTSSELTVVTRVLRAKLGAQK